MGRHGGHGEGCGDEGGDEEVWHEEGRGDEGGHEEGEEGEQRDEEGRHERPSHAEGDEEVQGDRGGLRVEQWGRLHWSVLPMASWPAVVGTFCRARPVFFRGWGLYERLNQLECT